MEQNTTASLEKLAGYSQLEITNSSIDYSKLGNALQELLEKKD